MGNTRQPGIATTCSSTAHRNVSGKVGTSRASSPGILGQEELSEEQKVLLLDVTQIVLDITGIFEPTPFSDLSNATISAFRSDWSGTSISMIGTIPYLGDAAKAGKFPRHLKTLERVIVETQKSVSFSKVARPLLIRIYSHVDALPHFLPASMRGQVKRLRVMLSESVGVPGRLARTRVLVKKLRLRITDPDDVLDTIEELTATSLGNRNAIKADDLLAELLSHVDNFDGAPTLRALKKPELAVRASDAADLAIADPILKRGVRDALESGRYLVPGSDLAKAADRNASAVTFDWNKMSALEVQEIPIGALVLEGRVARLGALTGGGQQIFHFGHLSTSGSLSGAHSRAIVDGVTRLLGGKTVRTQ